MRTQNAAAEPDEPRPPVTTWDLTAGVPLPTTGNDTAGVSVRLTTGMPVTMTTTWLRWSVTQ